MIYDYFVWRAPSLNINKESVMSKLLALFLNITPFCHHFSSDYRLEPFLGKRLDAERSHRCDPTKWKTVRSYSCIGNDDPHGEQIRWWRVAASRELWSLHRELTPSKYRRKRKVPGRHVCLKGIRRGTSDTGDYEKNLPQDEMHDLQMGLESSIGDGPCANICTQSDGEIRDGSSKIMRQWRVKR